MGKSRDAAARESVRHGWRNHRGTPDLVVGSRVTLERCGSPFDGEGYYTTLVRHTYDLSNGHRTYFEAERATIQGAA